MNTATQIRLSPQQLAADIRAKMPHDGATWMYCRPYVDAMDQLTSWHERYGAEAGTEIGLRFLVNAAGWRGAEAKALKEEIKAGLRLAGARV